MDINSLVSEQTFMQLQPTVQITLILAVTACFGMTLYYIYRLVKD